MKTSNLAVLFHFPSGSLFCHSLHLNCSPVSPLLYFYRDLRRRADGCLPAVISLAGNNGLTIIYSHPAQYLQQN
jgi:hypothetical protein